MWLVRLHSDRIQNFVDADQQDTDIVFSEPLQILIEALRPLYDRIKFSSHDDYELVIMYDNDMTIKFGTDFITIFRDRDIFKTLPYSEVNPSELLAIMDRK